MRGNNTRKIPSRKQSCQDVRESLFIIDLVYKIWILFPTELLFLILSCWKSFPYLLVSLRAWFHTPCHSGVDLQHTRAYLPLPTLQSLRKCKRQLIARLCQRTGAHWYLFFHSAAIVSGTQLIALFLLRRSCFLYTEWSTISSPLKFNLLLQRNKDVLLPLVCNNIASQIALWIKKCYKYPNISCEMYGQFKLPIAGWILLTFLLVLSILLTSSIEHEQQTKSRSERSNF